jgi:hypothetical protein
MNGMDPASESWIPFRLTPCHQLMSSCIQQYSSLDFSQLAQRSHTYGFHRSHTHKTIPFTRNYLEKQVVSNEVNRVRRLVV